VKWTRVLPGLLGLAGAVLIALPVEAARLQSWRFDTRQNLLTFTTDTRVQPRAQLIFNPTRLVIDLPGTTLGQRTNNQRGSNGIREIRVGQVSDQTTRIVVEFEPGYTVDPQQVQVRGQTDRQWSVQLPPLQRVDPTSAPPAPTAATTPNQVSNQPVQTAATRIQGIVATADGFFIRTRGEVPEVRVERSTGGPTGRQITLDLQNTAIAIGVTPQTLPVNRYSISSWELTQVSVTPPVARITMNLGEGSPDWKTLTSDIGGVVILPDGVAIREVADAGEQSASGQIVPVPAPSQPPRPAQASPPPVATPPRPTVPSGDLPQIQNGRFLVVIDPGHGGRDPGAVGIGGLQEKQVIFPISQEVAALLRQQGVEVVMTRDQDTTLDLAPRVSIANRANADLFISIHANAISLSRPDVNGLETYYYSRDGARFARVVHDIVLREMGMRDRRVRQARFYVIRHTSMPAILIETGFVTGAEDIVNLRDPAWRSRMATAIARGILTFIQQNY
jgi:N-acetylmuramoyl-L-alanine amidase